MDRILQIILTAFVLLGVLGLMWYRRQKGQDGGDLESSPTINPRQARGSKGATPTPTLDAYARDLTRQASLGQLDPVIGRDEEIARVIQILSRRTKNNPLLLGEPGVGKTAIAEGLARKIVAGEVTTTLQDKRVLALDVTSLISGTKYRGEFEKRLKQITEEITAAQRSIILFIDEIHSIVQSRGAEGAINPADIFKPALARGELQAIGATTEEEYRKYIKPEKALERRFQPVYIGEPSIEATIQILKGLREVYEQHHRVRISDEAIDAAARLSEKIHDRYLPDKAIDLIDEGCAKVKLASITEQAEQVHASEQKAAEVDKVAPVDVKHAPRKLQKLRKELAQLQAEEPQILNPRALKKHYEKMIALQQEMKTIESAIREVEADAVWPTVTRDDIAAIVDDWALAEQEAGDGDDEPAPAPPAPTPPAPDEPATPDDER